ncbi:hypothetical protein [Microvirga thermotolerans]|uniref:Uncharacterized protein n=1 Tax=Microvirga thermotolerans TaxID=2651334 RepID=A0A5P9JZS3_9HYPH|nr:hypothetical protein [Microvirga thermotolerans]QFU17953.1 hypothetical protein GDR74_17990 [Microvirga thermotolerans]
MTDKDKAEPRVPTERPDPNAAARNPRPGSEDRPGFDLGGAAENDTDTVVSNGVPGGPRSDPAGGGGPT